MAKRQAGNKARAVSSSPGLGAGAEIQGAIRDANHALAERMAENRFTDMMSAGGVGHDRMALELLYWLPRDFMTLYQELYMRGLSNTDGGTESRGRSQAITAATGKAKAGTGGGAAGKTFKKYWVIQDEDALELKERIDKRLRSITREIRLILDEMDFVRGRRETEKEASVKTAATARLKPGTRVRAGEKWEVDEARQVPHCEECRVILASHWAYCPRCGCPTALNAR